LFFSGIGVAEHVFGMITQTAPGIGPKTEPFLRRALVVERL